MAREVGKDTSDLSVRCSVLLSGNLSAFAFVVFVCPLYGLRIQVSAHAVLRVIILALNSVPSLPSILGLSIFSLVVLCLFFVTSHDMRRPDLCHCLLLSPKRCSSESHRLKVGETVPSKWGQEGSKPNGKDGCPLPLVLLLHFETECGCCLVP